MQFPMRAAAATILVAHALSLGSDSAPANDPVERMRSLEKGASDKSISIYDGRGLHQRVRADTYSTSSLLREPLLETQDVEFATTPVFRVFGSWPGRPRYNVR